MSSDPPAVGQTLSEPPQARSGADPATQTAAMSSLPEEIRRQVEQEQALADAHKRRKDLEAEVKRLKVEKQGLQGDKEGARESCLVLGSLAL